MGEHLGAAFAKAHGSTTRGLDLLTDEEKEQEEQQYDWQHGHEHGGPLFILINGDKHEAMLLHECLQLFFLILDADWDSELDGAFFSWSGFRCACRRDGGLWGGRQSRLRGKDITFNELCRGRVLLDERKVR